MNVTELARKLRVHPKKLLEILPEFGFDIGGNAIKVDDRIAQNIMKSWRRIKSEMEKREEKEKAEQKELEKKMRQESGETVEVPQSMTVSELAEILDMQTTRLIMELMKNGILATKNENIDRDTATLVAEELGYTVKEAEEKDESEDQIEEHIEKLDSILADENSVKRPPVIVVVGHVDHGKTKLLDAIRSSDVVSKEAGGITQHIGAYQVNWQNPNTKEKSALTFIDTPGHEAFTVMRSRGAKVADISILVVAADDSVKPQTIESINIIKAAKIPVVVAINKIDKEGADVEKVKVDLSQHGIQCEKFGGDVPVVEISALQKKNIDKLLDVLLLVDEMGANDIKANPNRAAAGTVIEAHIDKGEGNVASVLVQAGTLRINDPLVINGKIYGKARAMKNDRGENLETATPSTPVRVLGFKVAPQVGDILDVGSVDGASKIDVKSTRSLQTRAERTDTQIKNEDNDEVEKNVLNVLVKADTLGSLEAVISSLSKIEHHEVGIRVVGKGLGNVTTDDVAKVESAKGLVCAFNVSIPFNIKEQLEEKGLKFIEHKIIYDLIDDVKVALESLLVSETIRIEMGRLKIKAIFRTEKNKMVVGGLVTKGKIELDSKADILRAGVIVGNGKITKLQIGKQDEKQVPEGTECGLQFEGKEKLQNDDVLQTYKEEIKVKKLEL